MNRRRRTTYTMRYRRRFFMAGPVLLMSACSNPPYVPPEGLPLLFEAVEAEPRPV